MKAAEIIEKIPEESLLIPHASLHLCGRLGFPGASHSRTNSSRKRPCSKFMEQFFG